MRHACAPVHEVIALVMYCFICERKYSLWEWFLCYICACTCPLQLCTEKNETLKQIPENCPIAHPNYAEDWLFYPENVKEILSITSAEINECNIHEKWLQRTSQNTAADPKCAILCGHSPKEMHEWLQKSLIVDDTTSFLILCCVETLGNNNAKHVAVIIGLY